MVSKLLACGLAVGLVAGILTTGSASLVGEPVVDHAIAFEDAHAHAHPSATHSVDATPAPFRATSKRARDSSRRIARAGPRATAHWLRLGRGAIVVLLSDGWDRGEPEQLAAETARLPRCAHSLIWLNPLKAHPGYKPLTPGMQAALPHVDHFLSGNSISSLADLADLMQSDLR
jgi:hypothetical protein